MKKVILLILPSLVFAQQQDSISQINLEEVVVKAAIQSEELLGLTTAATVIPKSNPISFAQEINRIPGIQLQSGALNTNRISVRGIGARSPYSTTKIKMYYNGIPVTNGVGESTVEAFDLENTDRIRVVKGPKATAYGAALGGLLELESDLQKINGSQQDFSTLLGSYGLFKTHYQYNFSNEKKAFRLSLHHLDRKGYRQNNNFRRNGFWFENVYNLGNNHKLGFFLNQINYNAQIPSSLNQNDFENNPTKAAFTWNAAKGFEQNNYALFAVYHKWQKNRWQIQPSLYYIDSDHYEARPFNILDDRTYSLGYRITGTYSKDTSGFIFGIEHRKENYFDKIYRNLYREVDPQKSVQGSLLNTQRQRRLSSNYFLTHYGKWNQFSYQLGGNLNFNQYYYQRNSDAAIESLNKGILAPSVQLNYKNLGLNISQGYSNPSLEESLIAGQEFNSDLRPEIGTQYELSYHSTAEARLNWSAELYTIDVKDLFIEKRLTEDLQALVNAGRTQLTGLDLSSSYQIQADGLFENLLFSYQRSNHKFKDFDDEGEQREGLFIPGVPKHRLALGLSGNISNNISYNLNHLYTDAIIINNANTVYSPSFHRLDMTLNYLKKWSKDYQSEFTLGINNITNTAYASSFVVNAVGFGGNAPRYYYPADARNFFFSIRIRKTGSQAL